MDTSSTISLNRVPRAPVDIASVAIHLHPTDQVMIATSTLLPGTRLRLRNRDELRVSSLVPSGHKLAITAMAAGQEVRRYGQIIGFATGDIAAGDHVHTHNLAVAGFERDYAFCSEAAPVTLVPEADRRTFMGYRRQDGRVGTRNYVAVLATVNCSSSAARAVADHFRYGRELDAFPEVDGVIALTTKGGCGAHHGSAAMAQLQRTMAGVVDHPNVAGYVILGLGCEVNQPDELVDGTRLGAASSRPLILRIQEEGGYRQTVEAAIEAVRRILPEANRARRERVPVSELVVALQCGGSDSWSGVTANPALGLAADAIVGQGGTVVLAETTEIYGGEHLLTRRARNPEVGARLVELIHWWETYTAMHGASIDNNPAPGNKLGGLTTIYEKSLGAIAKAGSTPLNQVVGYAERITARGFVHMDSPGYDPVSVTGQVAGGCNLVCFTTGRGSAFGFKPAPSIKIASNSELYRRQEADMDVDAGRVLAGASLEEVAREIFEKIIEVASGAPSKSEAEGLGDEEFNPWILGAML